MKYLRLLLWPFSLFYGAIIIIRNWCYDAGWFKSTSFNLPVIAIGNLTVGGAGKSPMTEYLITLLKPDRRVATLSRGYGRNTKGFIIAGKNSSAEEIGDEPAQFKQKFPEVTIAVCEDRVTGVDQLKNSHDVILLDDAFQHRAIKAGLNLLLFDYNKLTDHPLLLPAGNLREPMSGKMRADVVIVSKCPVSLSEAEQNIITQKLKLYPYQQIFFTAIGYKALQPFAPSAQLKHIDKETTVFLLTGIAGAEPLKQYLQNMGGRVIHHKYPDHHAFSLKNIIKLVDDFSAVLSVNKVIVTTEKDAQRLKSQQITSLLTGIPIMVQPIGLVFLNNGLQPFNNLIENYVRKYTAHGGLH